jgi:hypothetical protein
MYNLLTVVSMFKLIKGGWISERRPILKFLKFESGSWSDGAGAEGARAEGAGSEGAGSEGAESEGAGSEGAGSAGRRSSVYVRVSIMNSCQLL